MWKDTIVNIAYKSLRAIGFRHQRLLSLLHHRIRYPQWQEIIRNTKAPDFFLQRPEGQRVVVLSMAGILPLVNLEILMALSLQQRGANVEYVLCDGKHRQLCGQLTVDALEARPKEATCELCLDNSMMLIRELAGNLRCRFLSDLVTKQCSTELWEKVKHIPTDALPDYMEDGVQLGRAALMTALRHWQRGTFLNTCEEELVNRKMLHSAMLTLEASKSLLAEGPIHSSLFTHGIYESWGPVADYFKKNGVYFVTYDVGDRKDSYIFTPNASCRLADISGPFNNRWKAHPLLPEHRKRALEYFSSRSNFSEDLLKQTYGTNVCREETISLLGLRKDIPVFTLYGNILWDAAAVGRDLVFNDVIDWVKQTIDYASCNQDKVQLIIKPHPSEALRGTRQALAAEVRQAFPNLPANVILLNPKVEINAHSMMQITHVGLVHTSTVGLEMSIFGIPTIVVSQTHYRGYGFTWDPETIDEYFNLLADPATLKATMTEAKREMALKYFYVRCFHSWIDLPLLLLDHNRIPYGWQFDTLDHLLPGQNVNFDYICEGILDHRQDYVLE